MKHKSFLIILFVIVIANFLAQLPYYFHQYHGAPSIIGSLMLFIVLLWFLVGFAWLWQKKIKGYVLLLAFLITEFLFYVSTQVTQYLSGKGILLYVLHPHDSVLFWVFLIGYINLFASGFYIIYLIINKRRLINS